MNMRVFVYLLIYAEIDKLGVHREGSYERVLDILLPMHI